MASLSSQANNDRPNENGAGKVPFSQDIESTIAANSMYRLTAILQTTIELEPLFELFFGQIQHLLKLNSCKYSFPEKEVSLRLGKASTHSCDYSLSIQQHFLGHITFTRKQRFSQDELAQLESLIGTLVYPLRNALNYREAINQALRDPLTGLGNRGALENALEHQWQMAQRYEQDLGVLMVDIDHFKSINDTYGHDVGDYVIREVAKSINASTRQTDLTFRYGGEEFLVLLNQTSTTGSMIIAERIRENIESLEMHDQQGHTIKVSASIGGSLLRPGHDKNSMMRQADQALYHAKDSGRNRVEFYQQEKLAHHNVPIEY